MIKNSFLNILYPVSVYYQLFFKQFIYFLVIVLILIIKAMPVIRGIYNTRLNVM
jgi:hypothetical protein